MNISKIFYFFNFLFIVNLILPCLSQNKISNANNMDSLEHVDAFLEKRKKRKRNIILCSLILTGLITSAAIACGVGWYIKKNKDDIFEYPEYPEFSEFPDNFFTQPDGEMPGTSQSDITTESAVSNINKIDLNKPLIENNKQEDISFKKFNAFVDSSRLAIKNLFNSLNDLEKSVFIVDKDYMRKVIQNLESNRNVELSRKQEDKAVLEMEYYLQKLYANYLSEAIHTKGEK
ncbi:early transcribed membrane protein [Plasmodium gallinaceum]|uniref:Early transcribed membrane protein n=1 Tax=Plasmodium gallinaceum TaxID=5849 RepID=A0A1J1GT39_PLAGA|nr:early transcribed membrane protein [Plasmodium gallinaceum]CRG95454.1 early transcribed membrane protein [Plasmodium gallinaceum]